MNPDHPSREIDRFQLPLRPVHCAGELGDAVRQAAADGHAVYPVGGGTRVGYGLPPAKEGVALDLRGLAKVVDYPARDMTVTVEAGITVAGLQELLAAEGQRLPVDVPRPAEATLGGAIAANTSGPRRHGFGTLRDYVIGIGVVNDRGEFVKAGGRVVKNVAGYDLCKLYTGSLGTLGVIAQVTLKVVPRPERTALVTLACDPPDLDGVLELVHTSRTRPACVELLNPPAVARLNREHRVELPADGWVAVIGFESNADAVNWQVQQVVTEVQARYSLEVRVDPAAVPLWDALAGLPNPGGLPFTFQAALFPGRCGEFCRRLAAEFPELLLQAHAGNGVVVGHGPERLTPEQAAQVVRRARELIDPQGAVVVLDAPAGWKTGDFVWGPPRGDWSLMRRIKAELDPNRVFNPGRFLGGL